MLSPVEAWWAGLYAQPFDGAQGDGSLFEHYLLVLSNNGLLPSQRSDITTSARPFLWLFVSASYCHALSA
jgi:hypothetical protein